MKKYLLYIVFIIFGILLFFLQTNTEFDYFTHSNPLKNIKLPPLIKPKECNTSEIAKNSLWLKIKIKEQKKTPIKHKNKNVYVQNNTVFINNEKYKYIGDYNNYAVFIHKKNGKTIFLKLKIKDKFPKSNLTIIKNNEKEILLKDNNETFKIKKPYVEIKKYQKKDINESQN